MESPSDSRMLSLPLALPRRFPSVFSPAGENKFQPSVCRLAGIKRRIQLNLNGSRVRIVEESADPWSAANAGRGCGQGGEEGWKLQDVSE